MGKGKKKNKHEEKVAARAQAAVATEVPVPSTSESQHSPSETQLSAFETQPSTSGAHPFKIETPVEQMENLTVVENKPEPTESKADDDSCMGLGLGVSSKKRPRKKKKDTSATAAEKKPDVSVGPTQETAGDTAAGPLHVTPTGQGTSAGPAGGAWGKPQPQALPISSSQQQTPVVTQQSKPSMPWGTRPPAGLTQPSLPQPTNPPSSAQPTAEPGSSQPPSFFPIPSSIGRGRGRGRGQTATQLEQRVVYKSNEPLGGLVIPKKVPGGIVTRQSTPIKVITNYLEMKIKPLKVYRYDVSFKPERPKKLLSKVFQTAKARHFPKNVIAFDQRKNCYTLTRLWNNSDERLSIPVEVLDDNGGKMSFEVVIKSTGFVDLNTILNHMNNMGSSLNPPTEAIQCIGVILQQGTLENYIRVGRQYFMRPRNPIDLGFGMEMWTGLFQSAVFTSRPFINIDVAHKAIPRQNTLLNTIIKDFQMDPHRPLNRQRGIDYFEHFLKGLRVKAKIGGGAQVREYMCNGLVDPPNRLTFTLSDSQGKGRTLTVEQYFEIEKRYKIRYPNLNCMWVGPKDKNIYYPLELLEVGYGQSINKQMNDKQLQTMVREAATPPNDRLHKIKEVIRNMNYSQNSCFKHFQLDVADKFYQVNAKILQAPKIDVGYERPIEPKKGAWQSNRFLKPCTLDKWGLVALDVGEVSMPCQGIIDVIKRVGNQLGMNVRDPVYTNFNSRICDIHKCLTNAFERRTNMLFVIVPGRFKDAYDRIKRMAELEIGILTQCIKEQTALRRMSEQTVRNILLKVNSKLMGVNQGLETRCLPECIKKGGVMMVGADVTHPSPEQRSIPSIAAVSASIDSKCFLYNVELSLQTPKEEIIVDFEEMIFDHLKAYRDRMNVLPHKIFVFRDGVSEGQFAQVMNSELIAVQKAYFRLEQRVKPEILFLLVQKRHHTRFFLGENNPQNVEPGTVVDTDIVHPSELDFYLVSHQAIKGTARPTRYHVICNDGKIPSDEVEQLAFYLCHLYSRCTRSVSYPAPTYYAHLACLRARTLTSGERFNNAELEKKPRRLRVLDRMLQYSRMFYI